MRSSLATVRGSWGRASVVYRPVATYRPKHLSPRALVVTYGAARPCNWPTSICTASRGPPEWTASVTRSKRLGLPGLPVALRPAMW